MSFNITYNGVSIKVVTPGERIEYVINHTGHPDAGVRGIGHYIPLQNTYLMMFIDPDSYTLGNGYGTFLHFIARANVSVGTWEDRYQSLNSSQEWDNTYDLINGPTPSGSGPGNSSTTPNNIQYRYWGVQQASSSPEYIESADNVTNYYPNNWTTSDWDAVADLIFGYVPPELPDDDPYSDIGDSTPGGGGGDFDDTTTDVDFPPLPPVSVSDAGFVTLFTPTLQQIRQLASYMWSGAFDPSSFKKIVANPMDVFIGLSILPIAIPHNATKNIVLGGIDTGVSMNLAAEQFVDVDFGTLTIKSGTGDSYLDYSPYTKASIFLPYIGWRDIDIDEIMKKTLHLKYRVDIVTGGCVAFLKCGGSVLYEWSGQCSINIPLTSIDWSTTYQSAISAVGHIAGAVSGVMTGAASANPMGIAGSVIEGASSLAGDVMSAKPQYPRSGALGGPSGVLGHQQAYIALTRPRLQKPKYQSKYMGYPSFVTKKVSDLVGTGFNAFSDIKLSGLGLLDDEMHELEQILKGGVYL